MHLDDPPERHQVRVGGLVHVESGTELELVSEDEEDLLVYAYGAPPSAGA